MNENPVTSWLPAGWNVNIGPGGGAATWGNQTQVTTGFSPLQLAVVAVVAVLALR